MKKRYHPSFHDIGGLKKLESLSDVPRAYAGLPFLSLLVPASPFRGIWWAQVGSSHSPTYRVLMRVFLFLSLLALPPNSGEFGGLKWARTTDLALIRRAL